MSFHGRRVPAPFGPAAGPHTQLAQNIALSWLAGGRVIELKTVQVRDDLVIPRPCIDMETVGFNVEWSQELRLDESLEEYVKASMLVRILQASGRLGVPDGFAPVTYDMSVGYDYAGITSPRVQAFIDGLLNASGAIDRLRSQIPAEFARFCDLDFPSRISDTLTLSTFHGCPPDEIERIVDHLLHRGIHCIVKLNPTLLGAGEVTRLLHDVLGYHDVRVPQAAFDRDTTWPQMCGFVERLGDTARSLGLGLGVKLTNTLIVENHRQYFPPTEREMYLSGPPLHVLAIELLRRFRREFGDRFPVSFSAGVDRHNFADAVALGLAPVTACTDLLKPQGYARAHGYYQALGERMARAGAAHVDDFVIRGHGQAEAALSQLALDAPEHRRLLAAVESGADLRSTASPGDYQRWREAAVTLNAGAYADRVRSDSRYAKAENSRPPRKIGRQLRLLDCISCDKCVPVCPNDAIFTFVVPQREVPGVRLVRDGPAWRREVTGTAVVAEAHQIGIFADFCNACGNCDVFCPEDGGPYLAKPAFFGSEAAWREAACDGFFVDGRPGAGQVLARLDGRESRLQIDEGRGRYSSSGFAVTFDLDVPESPIAGEAQDGATIDVSQIRLLLWLHDAVLAHGAVNFVSCRTG